MSNHVMNAFVAQVCGAHCLVEKGLQQVKSRVEGRDHYYYYFKFHYYLQV